MMAHLWPAELPGAFLTAGWVVLVAMAGTQAGIQECQAQGNAALFAASSNQESSEFRDQATGDWCGQRQRLKDSGVTLGAQLVLEGFKDFQGGRDTSEFVGALTFDLNATLDTGKAFGWQGGTFYVDLEDHSGQNPSKDLVGDLQVFDKQNARPYLQMFELWYQQVLFKGKLRLKVGKVDANTEFAVNDYGLPFLSSSAQVSPTVFVFPTTPDPMPAVNVFFVPTKHYYASLAAYYANRSVTFGNFMGHPQDAQLTRDGSFFIGETGCTWKGAPMLRTAGYFRAGGWGHTGTFTRLDGSRQDGVYGFYALLGQTLWQPEGEPEQGRGVRSFFEYGWTQPMVNAIDRHLGGGVSWTGPFAARADDLIGLQAQYAHLSREAALPHSYELAVEAFYRFRLSPWASLMPDLQFIIHPGGLYPDALVGTLRLTVKF